ncbi:prostaglandin E receptor 1c (subtype EP1) [Betta splendens]|uniref:Thromboxane A2 receptor n=1 Tax=Betta splendens TaxID=158456 RepID=A0A6P7N957_BETSP|nr:prostaglandin E receptor 1c (subtype EP1) [Betta splendens]
MPSMFTTAFSNSSVPPVLYHNLKVNSSEQPGPWFNGSSMPSISSAGLGMSCFTMIFGTISNLSALGILANSRIRLHPRSKAPFLLLTVALLMADLGSHVIPGSFALYLHMQTNVPGRTFCQIFGASMVFFGLCPLFIGCAMAVERCVAITQPFFHAAMITMAHVMRVVLLLSFVAFLLAVLPFFAVGTYTLQFPGTWCFLPINESHSIADTNLILAFSCLGLTALSLSLFCNIFSGLALLLARIRPHPRKKKSAARSSQRASSALSSSLFCSLDMEMMVQLAVITVVSSVCWGPFLIHILVMQFNQMPSTNEEDEFTLLALRMAAWNQTLDPWVYILLRRAVLFRMCVSTNRNPI